MYLSQVSFGKGCHTRRAWALLLRWSGYVVLLGGIVFVLTTDEKKPVGDTNAEYQVTPHLCPAAPSLLADDLPLAQPKCAGAVLGLSLRLNRKFNSYQAANSLARHTGLVALEVQRGIPQPLPLPPPRPLDRQGICLGCCVLLI
jgi:hypothetical protein